MANLRRRLFHIFFRKKGEGGPGETQLCRLCAERVKPWQQLLFGFAMMAIGFVMGFLG